MSANPTNHAGWAGGHAGEPSASAERRLGIPGKYHSVITVAAGTTASTIPSFFDFLINLLINLSGDSFLLGTTVQLFFLRTHHSLLSLPNLNRQIERLVTTFAKQMRKLQGKE